MPEPRPSPGPLIALLLAMVLGGGNPALAGSSGAPSSGHVDAPVDLSGHWAAADLGSIDLVQDGASLRGRSPEGVVIRGTVEGRIRGRKVQLCTGAKVRGDIFHASLAIEPNAIFEGAVKHAQDPMAEPTPGGAAT